MLRTALLLLALALATPAAALDLERLVENLSPEQRARYAVFEDFTIHGICGSKELELARDFGVNTIRNYTIKLENNETKNLLDRAHALGLKVIVSEWMPHQGENKGEHGPWNFDYTKNVEQRLAAFEEKVIALGDHPAILMWGLGNEVHLDPEYLVYVNKLSELIHRHQPLAITSLTMINAKPEHIERIKQHAPDLDVIGVQSYSPGAVRGGIRNMEEHWQKPYYYSEFNGKGPWNFNKTDWGQAHEDLSNARVADIHRSYDDIEAAPRCLGSTIFVWGHFNMNRPSYFSLLLSPHPEGPAAEQDTDLAGSYPLITPNAEVLAERFLGEVPGSNRAPRITALTFHNNQRALSAAPGEPIGVVVEATDANRDTLRTVAWVIDNRAGRARAVAGPFEGDRRGRIRFDAPAEPSDRYLVIAYVLDDQGGAAASTLPLQVRPAGPSARAR
ncbi:MAG: hypothetical protein AAF823_03045 [Planctomycetota bacterium]